MPKSVGLAMIVLVAGSNIALGGLITYTSQPAFNAAITSPTTFGFGGVAPSGSFTAFSSYSSNGVTFTPVGTADVDVTSANYYGASHLYPADFIVNAVASTAPAGMLLTLSTPITAIAFEIGSFDGGAIQASFSTGSTASLDPSPTLGNVTFWGFTSTTPFSTISLENSDGEPAVYVTSVTLAGAAGSTVPEPSTFALLALGVVAGAVYRRYHAH
jgi:hypothetical protein